MGLNGLKPKTFRKHTLIKDILYFNIFPYIIIIFLKKYSLQDWETIIMETIIS